MWHFPSIFDNSDQNFCVQFNKANLKPFHNPVHALSSFSQFSLFKRNMWLVSSSYNTNVWLQHIESPLLNPLILNLE